MILKFIKGFLDPWTGYFEIARVGNRWRHGGHAVLRLQVREILFSEFVNYSCKYVVAVVHCFNCVDVSQNELQKRNVLKW